MEFLNSTFDRIVCRKLFYWCITLLRNWSLYVTSFCISKHLVCNYKVLPRFTFSFIYLLTFSSYHSSLVLLPRVNINTSAINGLSIFLNQRWLYDELEVRTAENAVIVLLCNYIYSCTGTYIYLNNTLHQRGETIRVLTMLT